MDGLEDTLSRGKIKVVSLVTIDRNIDEANRLPLVGKDLKAVGGRM